jgi:hypothetical protein
MGDAASDEQASPRRSARALWVVVLGLALAAGALWGSNALTWTGGQNPAKGSAAVPELNTLALLALAALAAMFAGGAWLKRVIGALVVLSACYLLYLAVRGATPPPISPTAGHSTADPGQIPFARALCGVAGLLELAAAAALLWRPAGLPRMGSKYSRERKKAPADPDQRMWQALSEGDDPTKR